MILFKEEIDAIKMQDAEQLKKLYDVLSKQEATIMSDTYITDVLETCVYCNISSCSNLIRCVKPYEKAYDCHIMYNIACESGYDDRFYINVKCWETDIVNGTNYTLNMRINCHGMLYIYDHGWGTNTAGLKALITSNYVSYKDSNYFINGMADVAGNKAVSVSTKNLEAIYDKIKRTLHEYLTYVYESLEKEIKQLGK